ncbi:hypothetical protein MTP99_004070 [Tenebrio molitor]|nr:hypothetical protein MTP99_004070 [Tenebrio molitor]
MQEKKRSYRQRVVENNNSFQQRDEDNSKTGRRHNEGGQRRMHARGRELQRMNRRKRGKKSGTGERGWEKKIQRQGGKCRGEEREWRRNKIDRSRFLEAKRKYRLRCRERRSRRGKGRRTR